MPHAAGRLASRDRRPREASAPSGNGTRARQTPRRGRSGLVDIHVPALDRPLQRREGVTGLLEGLTMGA